MTGNAKRRGTAMGRWWGMAAVAVALAAGCSSDGESGGNYAPSVDVNGTWETRLDGDVLGTMVLEVSAKGKVGGTLVTLQDAEANLAGVMDGRDAEFTVQFPAEAYLAVVTFNENATGGTGTLIGNRGFQRPLASVTPNQPGLQADGSIPHRIVGSG